MGYVQEARENHVKKKVEEGNEFSSKTLNHHPPPGAPGGRKLILCIIRIWIPKMERWEDYYFRTRVSPSLSPFSTTVHTIFTYSDFMDALWVLLLHLQLQSFKSEKRRKSKLCLHWVILLCTTVPWNNQVNWGEIQFLLAFALLNKKLMVNIIRNASFYAIMIV